MWKISQGVLEFFRKYGKIWNRGNASLPQGGGRSCRLLFPTLLERCIYLRIISTSPNNGIRLNSLETHIVRKWEDIGHQRAVSPWKDTMLIYWSPTLFTVHIAILFLSLLKAVASMVQRAIFHLAKGRVQDIARTKINVCINFRCGQ